MRLWLSMVAFALASAIAHAGSGAPALKVLCAFGEQFKITLYSCIADDVAKSQYLLLNSWEEPTRAAAEHLARYGDDAWWVDDLQNLREFGTLRKLGLAANSNKADRAVGRGTALRLYACIQAANIVSLFDTEGDASYETALIVGPAALYLVARLKISAADLVNAMRAAEQRLLPDLAMLQPGQSDADALSSAAWRVFHESCTDGDAISAAQVLAFLANDRLKIAR